MDEAAPQAVETPPCPLCGSAAGGIVVATKGRFGMDVRNIACHECALVYQSPRPTHAAMMAYYAGEYRRQYAGVGFMKEDGYVLPGQEGFEAAMESWHSNQAEHSVLLGATRPGAKVLEIGCRHGHTLRIMKERFGIDPFGIEPGPEEAAQARDAGVPCFNGTLEEFDPGETRFDQIQLFHVFEHLHEPLDALLRFRALLAPGGKVVIEVPNVHQPYGLLEENFFQNAHITNFSAETLPAMFRRAGYSVEKVVDDQALFVVGTALEASEPLPLPFSRELLDEPRNPASWVAERLRTYADLEKIRLAITKGGVLTMPLVELLVKILRQRAGFIPHTVNAVTDLVEFFMAQGAPRLAAIVAGAAAAGSLPQEIRERFQTLALAASEHAEPAAG